MKFAFLVESYNDLDMICPLIWKAEQRQMQVLILNTGGGLIKRSDYRIKFLRQSGNINYLEIPGPILSRTIKVSEKIARYLPGLANCLTGSLLENSHENLIKALNSLLHCNYSVPMVIMGSYQKFTAASKILGWAEQNRKKVIINSHGIVPFVASGSEIIEPGIKNIDYDGISAVIVNNDNTIKHHAVDSDTIKIMGAPRFSLEWSEVLNNIYDRIGLPIVNSASKVVFMLSKWKGKDDRDAVMEAIRASSSISGCHVFVKPHTRGMPFDEALPGNVTVVDNDVHSRQLIENASAIVFTRSSIFLDAVLMDVPVLHLSYATSSVLASDSLSSCMCGSLEEFVSKLERLRNGERLLSEDSRRKCLKFYAGEDFNGRMLDRVIDELESLSAG